ncbi:MAG: hypothetical protein JXR31_14050 [Prolixibacteraceae bacterium]|nr:hypothetical protein [Prolixibacteraceae bacterium]
MKYFPLFLLINTLIVCSCSNNKSNPQMEGEKIQADSIVILKRAFENNPDVTEYEIPVFRNNTNMKHGIVKRYYQHGSLYSEIPYSYGLREGIAYTYYPALKGMEPVIWKEQPYRKNKLEGICRRYHKNGNLQAEYEYKEGLPAIGLKEFKDSGIAVKLPQLIVETNKLNSNFYITARLSNNSKKVDYYIGELFEGKYLPAKLKGLQIRDGVGEVLVPLTTKSITITATYTTQYQNKYIVSKTIIL